MKQVVKKQYSKSADKTKFIYDDGSEEIVSGPPELAQPIKQPSAPGMLQTAAMEFGQGATFGLGDEIYGGAMGAADVISEGDLNLDSLLSSYQKNRDEARQELAAGAKENPTTATIANLAGSFAMPAGILGGTAKAATFGAKAMQGLKAGAAAGALAGLGQDEIDLTKGGSVSELAGNAAKSAAGGAVLGAGIGAVVPALGKAAYEFIGVPKYKGTQKIANAFNKAREGVDMLGTEAVEREARKTKELAMEIGKEIGAIKKYAGSIKGEALSNSDEVFLVDKYKELSEKIKNIIPASADEERLLGKYQGMLDDLVQKTQLIDEESGKIVTALKRPDANAEEIDKTAQALNKILYKNKNLPYEAERLGKGISEDLSGLAKQGISEENMAKLDIGKEGYSKAFEAQAKLGGIPSASGTTLNARMMYEKQVNTLMDDIRKAFARPGDTGAIAIKDALEITKKNIEDINNKLLATTQDAEQIANLKMVKDAQLAKIKNIETRVNEQGLNLATAEGLMGTSPFGGEGILKKITGVSGEGVNLAIARKAGQGVRAIETTAPEFLRKLSATVYNKSNENLKPALDILSQKGSPYASKLAFALKQDGRKRNAVLFSLMQQPDFRSAMAEVFGGE